MTDTRHTDLRWARRLIAPLAVAAMALALAPAAASAGLNVTGYFDPPSPFPEQRQTSENTNSLAVADSGGAWAGAGDAYVDGTYLTGVGSGTNTAGGFVKQISPAGALKRVWGADIVAGGPGDADETQAVRVNATAGAFTLGFGAETTAPLDFDADPQQVEDALNALGSISAGGGSVSVSGGPGDAGGNDPYLVSFDGGPLHGVDQPLLAADGAALSGGASTADVYTTNPGDTGFEVCEPANEDACKAPIDNSSVGAGLTSTQSATRGGALGSGPGAMAVDQANGEVLVRTALSRVTRYSPSGEFISTFGLDVVRQGPGDSNVDEVQTLTVTATSGSYTLSLRAFDKTETSSPLPFDASAAAVKAAIDALPGLHDNGGSVSVTRAGVGAAGNPLDPYVYTITFGGAFAGDSLDHPSVQPGGAGSVATVQDGGGLELCTVEDVCKPGDDSFLSAFDAGGASAVEAIDSVGSQGMAVAPPGSPNQGNVLVSGRDQISEFTGDGEFVRAFGWDVVRSGPSEVVAPDEVQQLAVKADGGTFTLTFFGKPDSQTTAPIPYNATPAQVKSALEALSTFGGAGGTVAVSGGPGDLSGSTPYTITFGGSFAGDSVVQMGANASALTISSGTKSATVTTLTEGGAFEVCKGGTGDVCEQGSRGAGVGQFNHSTASVGGSIVSIAEDEDGAIYAVEAGGNQAADNRRVQKFTPAGGLALVPSAVGVDERQQLRVNAAVGQFRLVAVDPRGTTGTAKYTAGDHTLTNVTTNTGAFVVGERLYGGSTVGSTITAIGPGTITVAVPPSGLCAGSCPISSSRPFSTPDLPYNAGPAAVQAAIDDLQPIKADGSSVTVTGGPGDAGGNNPYLIVYDGGRAPRTDFPPLRATQGSTPLGGGSGPGADQAVVETLVDGGPGARSEGQAPSGVAVLPGGETAVTRPFGELDAPCAAGLPFAYSFGESRIQMFSADGTALLDSSLPCAGAGGIWPSADPTSGDVYVRGDHVYIYGEAGTDPGLSLDADAGDLGSDGATVTGTIDPNGIGPIDRPNPSVTRYRVDFRKVGDSDWTTYVSGLSAGSGPAPVPFSVGISGLLPKTAYEARVIVTKPFGFTVVSDTTNQFTTLAGKPTVASSYTDNVTAGSVDLHALINPSGAETSYHFEYGTTTGYGQSTPPVAIGDGATPVPAQAQIASLEPVVYHFRVVATNSEGTTFGPDQTFNFYPEPCPNSTARQQTGSSLLPDCRAYELVSPGNMGSISLTARGPNSPLASNPPRFAYMGLVGILPGPWNPPNQNGDNYVATRTDNGWRSSFVGLAADHSPNPGARSGAGGIDLPGDLGLDRFLQWGLNTDKNGSSAAPYLFDADGNTLGRLPTDLDQLGDTAIDSGGFVGDELLSGDGKHFVYSSADVAMAPGGLITGAGSVYDNEIATGNVSIVSKTESGADIPAAPGTNAGHYLLLPGVSTDGSHILIAAPAACNSSIPRQSACPSSPAVLYMRVDGTHSFDVSEGHAVSFEGMTADGSEVLFTSAEQLTADDTDTGVDLFMWSEATDSIARLSVGAGLIGDSDGCAASWVDKCGVQVVPTRNLDIDGQSSLGEALEYRDPTDTAIGRESGDAYFYSPEQFVASKGYPGRRNLYVNRDGNIRFVAALDVDKPATRIQVSADGRFAAFLTTTRLTAYDNAGRAEMYRYDDASGELTCVSCDPTGAAPSHDAEASKNGLFMADDGRAFFATRDPLVARDTDGLKDVYEFVNGRAQLITTGAASSVGNGYTGTAGLVGVSADGVDVYFSTLETLVPEDENGLFLKFYDARVNGGFPVAAEILPCAAAEECRGPRSAAPALPPSAAAARLGGAGNAASSPRRPKRCRKGKVLRRGKCVRKKRRHRNKKQRHKHDRAHGAQSRHGYDRGARR